LNRESDKLDVVGYTEVNPLGRVVGKPWIDARPDVELADEHRAFLVKSFGSKTSETS
jgi:hypothetical protein